MQVEYHGHECKQEVVWWYFQLLRWVKIYQKVVIGDLGYQAVFNDYELSGAF